MSTPQPIKPSAITLQEHRGRIVYGWPELPCIHSMPRKAVVCVDYTTCLYPSLIEPKAGLQFDNADGVSNADLGNAIVFWTSADCYEWLSFQVMTYTNTIHALWNMEDE